MESGQPFGISRKCVGQDLDRDLAIELRIACAIDFAHPPGAQRAGDLEGADACPGRHCHARSILPYDDATGRTCPDLGGAMKRMGLLAFLLVMLSGGSFAAQWLDHPTPGLTRTADGKPNLSAPA